MDTSVYIQAAFQRERYAACMCLQKKKGLENSFEYFCFNGNSYLRLVVKKGGCRSVRPHSQASSLTWMQTLCLFIPAHRLDKEQKKTRLMKKHQSHRNDRPDKENQEDEEAPAAAA